MTITKLDFYLGVFFICFALGGGIVAHGYFASRQADLAALSQVKKDTAATTKAAEQTITTAQKAEAQNQQDLSQKLLVIHDQQQVPVTPVDYGKIDAMIQARMAAPAKTQTVDDKPETTVETKPLRDYMLSCDANAVSLDSCKATVANDHLQITALDDENKKLVQEVAVEDKIAKGGSFWHRFGRGVKHSLCGAAGMGAGVLAARSASSQGGAITGAGVWAGCEVLVNR